VQGLAGRPKVCRHNMQYWYNLPYLGFGAGAHGYAVGCRTANVLPVLEYIQKCQQPGSIPYPAGPAAAWSTPVDNLTSMQETMMVGLRLLEEGVSRRGFASRFGRSMESVFGEQIQRLVGEGLLERSGDALRLTQRGHLLGNRVFGEFI
jgi:oxygen-independent coproporphyrinogen-3 oxidase